MKLPSLQVFLFAVLTSSTSLVQSQECSTEWKCHFTETPPVLDADFGEWANVDPYVSSLINTVGEEYEGGKGTFKCLYDSENIYLMMEIPGEYRFSTEDNHLCAAIGTMMKVGPKASFLNMGGCPDAMGGCEDGVPETCVDYTVDIGAHWELKTTEQSTLYSMGGKGAVGSRQGANETDTETTPVEPAGNDLVANNDDEYAVSPYCRFDDDDAKAGNEWSGAWAHTSSVEGEMGNYHFEVSRTLKTDSTVSDKQLAPGETVEFGIAYWDPFQIDETGWNDIGHFFTGCGTKWVNLELVVAGEEDKEPVTETSPEDPAVVEKEESAASILGLVSSLIAPALVALL